MSVATSTVTLPPLKSVSARVRAPWLLLPWIAAVRRPDFSRNVASLSAPCFVRPKTSVWRRLSAASRCSSTSRFLAPSTGCTRCVIVAATLLRAATWISAGSRMNCAASCLISSANVAEKSSVWRCLRQRAEDALDRGHEAHVEHAVGFVEDEDFDARQIDGAALHVIDEAARRGDDDVDAATQRVHLRTHADAAEDGGAEDAQVLAVRAHAFVHLCGEFARRREDQRARSCACDVGCVALANRRSSSGSANAAVLPVPVCAPARISRPARTVGIAAAWIGVGSV